MKKLLITMCTLIFGLAAQAAITADQALSFFQKYIDAANGYQEDIISFYTPDAKIIRNVNLPKGGVQQVTATMETYANQMRLGATGAKFKKYKNTYTNRKVEKVGNDYKISAIRKPSTSDDKFPVYFIIGEDSNGKLKIKEEMMYSNEQLLLKLMKK